MQIRSAISERVEVTGDLWGIRVRKKWLGNTWVGKRGRSAGYGRWAGCAGHVEQALTFPSMHASACYCRRRQGSFRQLVAIAWPLALSLCCALVVRVGGDDAWQAEVQADEHGEGCTASAEPNDGTVFRDEAVPVVFVAVGFCPRAERAHAAGSGRAVAVELKLEPGGRQFRWNLEHGIDEFGVELQLPRNLPDEVYRGSIALSAPYNLVLPIHFAKLTTGARQLQVVFPVPGFVFGRASQAWLQVLVIDEGARARGVREVGYLLDVLVNGTHVHSVRSANGRRIYVPAARPGVNAVRLIVKNVLGEDLGLSADVHMHVSANHDADIPPGPATLVSPASAACSRADGQGTSQRDAETSRLDMAASASVAASSERPFTCPPVEPGAPSACDLLSGDERGGVSSACSGHGACVGSGVAGLGGGAVCVCEGDWFGDTCEHSAMHHSSFVPEIDPARSSARCMQAQGRQAAVAAWLQRLEADAKPATCGIDEAFVQEFSGTRGLGITWRWLSLALSTALQRGKTLVVGGRWPWFDFAGCHEGMRCYLEPLSNCTGAMIRDDMLARMLAQQSALKAGGDVSHLHPDSQDALRRRRWLPHGEAEIGRPEGQRVEGERPDGDSDGEAAELRRRAWVENLDLEGQVPQVLEVADDVWKQGGVLWWNALMLRHVLRPNAWLRDQVRDARNRVGLRHPVLGMHVRQGDACSDWSRPAPCPPLERYMEAARQMRLRYGVTTIYLATDSGVALASLQRELVAKENFTILSLPGLDRGVFDSNLYIEFRVQMQLVDRRAVTHSSFLDLFLLAECDYFVGTLSSAFSAVALELSFATKGFLPPYISLDIPWRPFRPFGPYPTLSMQHLPRA